MSGHELREEQIGMVHRPTGEQRAQWALRLARQAVAKGHGRDAVVDVLEALGLVDPSKPLPQPKTDVLGATVYERSDEVKARAAARKREYKRERREEAS